MTKKKYSQPAVKKVIFTDEAILAPGCKVTSSQTAKNTKTCGNAACKSTLGTQDVDGKMAHFKKA